MATKGGEYLTKNKKNIDDTQVLKVSLLCQ